VYSVTEVCSSEIGVDEKVFVNARGVFSSAKRASAMACEIFPFAKSSRISRSICAP
jgi:hypothetical protein